MSSRSWCRVLVRGIIISTGGLSGCCRAIRHKGDIVIAAQTEMMRHEKGTVRAYLLGFAWTYLVKDNPHY